MTSTTLPPLTAADFDMQWDAEHTFPFIESEDATIMAFGHHDKAAFVRAVREYDDLCTDDAETHAESDVDHFWAVQIDRGNPEDGWWMSWSGVTAETPNAFPITVILR